MNFNVHKSWEQAWTNTFFSCSTIKRRTRNWGNVPVPMQVPLRTSYTLKHIFLQHDLHSWKAFGIWSNKLKVCQFIFQGLASVFVFPAGSQEQAQVQDPHLWEPHLLWPLRVPALRAPAPGHEMWQWVKFPSAAPERECKPWITASYFISLENTISNVSYL